MRIDPSGQNCEGSQSDKVAHFGGGAKNFTTLKTPNFEVLRTFLSRKFFGKRKS